MKPSEQALLFEAAAGFRAVNLTDFVPEGTPPFQEVIHHGRNSLPTLRFFEKRFCLPEIQPNELWGYNQHILKPLIGPGYFVVRQHSASEVMIDYTEVPPSKPASWPKVVPNSARLGRFVYDGLRDIMRGVSRHYDDWPCDATRTAGRQLVCALSCRAADGEPLGQVNACPLWLRSIDLTPHRLTLYDDREEFSSLWPTKTYVVSPTLDHQATIPQHQTSTRLRSHTDPHLSCSTDCQDTPCIASVFYCGAAMPRATIENITSTRRRMFVAGYPDGGREDGRRIAWSTVLRPPSSTRKAFPPSCTSISFRVGFGTIAQQFCNVCERAGCYNQANLLDRNPHICPAYSDGQHSDLGHCRAIALHTLVDQQQIECCWLSHNPPTRNVTHYRKR